MDLSKLYVVVVSLVFKVLKNAHDFQEIRAAAQGMCHILASLSFSDVDRTGFSYELVSHCFCECIFGIHTFSRVIPGTSEIFLIWIYARRREV